MAGHSLGGALTVAVAAWLSQALAGRGSFVLVPESFAAQTAWNPAFAEWFGGTFSYAAATNANDVIPMMWARLPQFLATYEPAPRLAVTDPDIWRMYDLFYRSGKVIGDHYREIASRFGLRFTLPVNPDAIWLEEAGRMHAMKTAYFPHATQRTAPTLPHSKN